MLHSFYHVHFCFNCAGLSFFSPTSRITSAFALNTLHVRTLIKAKTVRGSYCLQCKLLLLTPAAATQQTYGLSLRANFELEDNLYELPLNLRTTLFVCTKFWNCMFTRRGLSMVPETEKDNRRMEHSHSHFTLPKRQLQRHEQPKTSQSLWCCVQTLHQLLAELHVDEIIINLKNK